MLPELPEIIHCPPQRVAEALSLVLSELAPSLRRDVAGALFDVEVAAELLVNEPLYVALRGEQICGVAWGQRQSGNVAVFWPPWLTAGEDFNTACRLAEQVVKRLDETTVEMTQVLVSSGDSEVVRVLEHVDFRQLTNLLYLTCESQRFPRERPKSADVEFITYDGTQRSRLMRLVERTYEGTLDCTSLNGVRHMDNVITGYQATGVYRPENWFIVRAGDADVGILLLADHPQAGHWELMYMGLVPEARGHGWGRQVTQFAQWLAGRANVERIVLAVDAVNDPALRMYRSTGFEIWDRRTVYVRFPAKLPA
ncbi:MAG: GNAT family N-acetyltransferase [Planctomycetes bacterium]|nr:GNAT family N-acetyltransferase [Planctomycetota bacterium]